MPGSHLTMAINTKHSALCHGSGSGVWLPGGAPSYYWHSQYSRVEPVEAPPYPRHWETCQVTWWHLKFPITLSFNTTLFNPPGKMISLDDDCVPGPALRRHRPRHLAVPKLNQSQSCSIETFSPGPGHEDNWAWFFAKALLLGQLFCNFLLGYK